MASAGEQGSGPDEVEEPVIRAYLLGRFAVAVRGSTMPDDAWPRRKARQLFKCLLTRPNRRLTKDEAFELLWPESDPDAAATNLRSTVHALRRALGAASRQSEAELIAVDRDAISLRPDIRVWVDAEAFESAMVQVRRADDPGPWLEVADELYLGDYLPDDLYEDWASARRGMLKRAWVDLQLALARARERRGEPDRAAVALHRLLQADPCDERAGQELMQLLARQGRGSDALRVYQRLVQALRHELEAEPSAATIEIGRRLVTTPPLELVKAGRAPSAPKTSAAVAEPLSGTVTFLFTDIEGSTRLVQEVGPRYAEVLETHRCLLRSAFQAHGGREVDTQGDSFFVAFGRAVEAVAAAAEGQRQLVAHRWPQGTAVRVRMGLHTGEPALDGESYTGLDVHRAARLCAAAHGGQVLLSQTTRDLVQGELPSGVTLQDLGAHRLKDLPHPERVYQAVIAGLPAEFPPLAALSRRFDNLPAQTTHFIGRQDDLATVRQILLREDVRLLTLSGPGGVGKTRLALQVASEVLDAIRDGVCFVSLAPIGDPLLVASTIARALGVREVADRPVLTDVLDFLRDMELLLLLDNFEQVAAAAPLVAELLAACPRLSVLVTSRASLHLYGEHIFPVAPLSLPEKDLPSAVDQLFRYDAVQLFAERAQAAQPDIVITPEDAAAMAEICRQLDGLPLAIELAAARVRLFSPQAILARLNHRLLLLTAGALDLPPRHRALRATMDWSHDLLDESERQLFRRLAIFVGGCTLEAAEAVCMAGGSVGIDVLDGVAELVDRNLLRREVGDDGQPRFTMLETIREYALEQLDVSGEASAIRRRHAEYYLALVEAAEPELRGTDQEAWLARLEREHGNFRAGLAFSLGNDGDVGVGLRLAGALAWFWHVHAQAREGRGWLELALAQHPVTRTAARAKALQGLGMLAHAHGDYERGMALFKEALDLYRDFGDSPAIALTLDSLGRAAWRRGDYDVAKAHLEESLAHSRALGDPWCMALALQFLGLVAQAQGNHAEAAARAEEALTLRRELGDKRGIAYSLMIIGQAARAAGDLGRATLLLEESLTLHRALGDTRGAAYALNALGLAFGDRRDYRQAEVLQAESLALFRELGDKGGIAESLEAMAGIAAAQHRTERVVRLCSAAQSIRAALGAPPPPISQAMINRELAGARAELGEEAFATEWAIGHTSGSDQIVDYALAPCASSPSGHGPSNTHA